MRKWLLRLGGGLILLLIILVGVSALTTQLEKRHEKQIAGTFVQAVLSNNSEGSYAMFSDVAQKVQPKDDWTAKVQKLSTFFKGQQPAFQQLTESIDKSTHKAVANYKITGSDGDYVMNVTLMKTKVGWQVLTFTSLLQINK